ncbi:MAG: septum formation protein Maf [Myxococcales bacterium]|nr:septum formation protein Maf [Myxococcales bacterium]
MLVLASSSPRRRALLEQVGIPHVVHPAEIDESRLEGATPREHAERLAREKARVVSERMEGFVLGADTVVVVEGELLEKPADDRDAERMIGRLAGRVHEVFTAVALAKSGEILESQVHVAKVRFRPLDPDTVRRYVATGEGRDKAGAYGVQGVGAGLVESIEGDYGTVVGLPLAPVILLLERHGAIGAWP